MLTISDIDTMIGPGGKYGPRWGWHDNHRDADGTAEYLPALMQVRSEFAELLNDLDEAGLGKGRCLQLGLGNCRASHDVWNEVFAEGAVTIDFGARLVGRETSFPGCSTHDTVALAFATRWAPYDMLFIDAGHLIEDVEADHRDYGPLVRSGGIIAFHDSLPRASYPGVKIWQYLEPISGVKTIGREVGISWLTQA